jgi:hypothetical protein
LAKAVSLLSSSELPATASILRVANIVFADPQDVQTTKMQFNPKTAQVTLLVNQEFVSQHAETPLRLAALVIHEMLHHLLHHYVLYPMDRITNIAQDALINALICRLAPSFQQLFTTVYSKTEFPSMYLRPGSNLKRIEHEEIYVQLRATYQLLYRKATRSALKDFAAGSRVDTEVVTVADLKVLLERIAQTQKSVQDANIQAQRDKMHGLGGLVPDWWEDSSELLLLGSHGDDADDPFDTSGPPEEHAAELQDLLEDLNRDLKSNANAGALYENAFRVSAEDAPNELLEALNAGLRQDVMKMRRIIEDVIGPRPNMQTVVPRHIGRKEAYLIACGVTPIFYPAYGPGEKPQNDVIIYVDVSGSMGDQASFVLMLLSGFHDHISTEFFQFSTEVVATPFVEFKRHFEATGQITQTTSGGTNFDPIFEHAEAQGYKKIVLITDGCANLSPQWRDFAESIETFTVYTINHQTDPLSDVSRKTWVMPSITVKLERV